MLLHMHHVELAKMLQLPCKSSYLYQPPRTQTHTLGHHPPHHHHRHPMPLYHPDPLHLLHPATVTSRWALLSTCWSGEAHLWAYLAPLESSKHSFLWLSVWWRWAAMWNRAQHQWRSQQWKYSWLEGCESHSSPLLSQKTMALLSNPSRIDLGLVFCVICFVVVFSLHVFICCFHVETHDCTHCFLFVLVETKKKGKFTKKNKKRKKNPFRKIVNHTETNWKLNNEMWFCHKSVINSSCFTPLMYSV